MALNTLTLAVVQGAQGRRFRSLIYGLTAGTEVTVDVDATPGFGVVNGRLSHHSLPYTVNTVAIRERVPATGETKVTRIEINAASATELATQAAALLTSDRTLRSYRVAATDDGAGSLTWAVYAEDDLGATATTSVLSGWPLAAFSTYWSANSASVTGALIDSVAGSKGRTLLKTADATRPTLSAGRMVFTSASTTRLLEGGALQPTNITPSLIQTLADGGGTDSGKGQTGTGFTEAPDATYWAMNFGSPVEGSPTVDPSIIQYGPNLDVLAKLSELLFSGLQGNGGVKPTTGAQGLTTMPDGLGGYWLVFWVSDKFWFVTPAGVIVGTLAFTAFQPNALTYDPARRKLVAAAAGNNSNAFYIDLVTAATTPAYTVYGTGIDHFVGAPINGIQFYIGGDNGSSQGAALRGVEVQSGRTIYQQFLTSPAPEGGVISWDGTQYVLRWLDDGYHHGTYATNTIRRGEMGPSFTAYPGTGRQLVVAGVAKLDTAPGSTAALWTIGQPVTSGAQGVGLFFPASVTNGLRLQINNIQVNWTVPTTTTEFLHALVVDYGALTASLWINGVLISTQAIPGLSAVSIMPPMQVMLGACREVDAITRSATFRTANLLMAADPTLRVAMQVEAARDAGRLDLLPA